LTAITEATKERNDVDNEEAMKVVMGKEGDHLFQEAKRGEERGRRRSQGKVP